jgi:hypothetical protein
MIAIKLSDKELHVLVSEIIERASKQLEGCVDDTCFGDTLARELQLCECPFERGVWVPERLGGLALNCGQVLDFLINGNLALVISHSFGNENEAEARLLYAMRLLGLQEGLLVAVDSGCTAQVRRVQYR